MAGRTKTLLAGGTIAVGLFQAAFAVTRESLAWSLFYVVFGLSLAIVGGVSLWTELHAER